jgi:hypothetical protein
MLITMPKEMLEKCEDHLKGSEWPNGAAVLTHVLKSAFHVRWKRDDSSTDLSWIPPELLPITLAKHQHVYDEEIR